MITQFRSKRKLTGGRYVSFRKKRKANQGREPIMTKLAEKKLKTLRTRGGKKKVRIVSMNKINVLDTKTNKFSVVEIEDVLDNSANKNYIRRKILNKGVIVKTQLGKVRITSRPGQVGTLNGVLIEQ